MTTKHQHIEYGFIAPKIDASKHFILGSALSLKKDILQADGQWDKYLPTYEPQFGNGWDTNGCTVWGTENAIEMLFNKIYNSQENFSERFNYILTPVSRTGADPHEVADCIRDRGLINQDLLPMTASYEEFITPNPMAVDRLVKGQQWLGKYSFGHEWVFQGERSKEDRIALMKQALQYSPLGVSVTAWFEGADGIYIDNGYPNSHWCVCYGWDDDKQAWKIFDSYDQSIKLYSFNSRLDFCKRYSLTPALNQVAKSNWFIDLIRRLLSIFKK